MLSNDEHFLGIILNFAGDQFEPTHTLGHCHYKE